MLGAFCQKAFKARGFCLKAALPADRGLRILDIRLRIGDSEFRV